MSPNPKQILENYYHTLLVEKNTQEAVKLWTDDTILHYPGNHIFSGTHIGVTWLSTVYRPVLNKYNLTLFKDQLLSKIAGDSDYAISHYTEHVINESTGEKLTMVRKTLYGFTRGKISSIRMFDEDPEAVDDFFNRNIPTTLAELGF